MKPLFFAMLKYYSKNVGVEASRADVQDALRGVYSSFKAFRDKDMDNALMTACANGIIHESRFELDGNGNLVIFYACTEEEANIINRYID